MDYKKLIVELVELMKSDKNLRLLYILIKELVASEE